MNKSKTYDGPSARDKADAELARLVAHIIDAIETGAASPADWSLPWHNVTLGVPTNARTGAPLTGGNRVILWMETQLSGASHYWATYDQWAKLTTDPTAPVHVRKGETGTYVWRPTTTAVTDAETGEKEYRTTGFVPYKVFHAGQVEGWSAPETVARPPLATDERADVGACFRWMATTGATVVESATAGASYSRTFDRVTMPDRDRFVSGHAAWSSGAHELCHWTGHPSRLNRDMGKRFGDDAYAAEELVAELGAAFTLAQLGRTTEPREDHAQYLAGWLRVLKSRPDALLTVAGRAGKASALVLERSDLMHLVAA